MVHLMPTVLSINTGKIAPFDPTGKARPSGIVKTPREGRVPVGILGPEGDEHAADVHGGEYQAVYAYSVEDYAWWAGELDRELNRGLFGENLTTHGIDLSQVVHAERWRVGSVVLEATQPRLPCATFQARMQEERWLERFDAAGRWGIYWRVAEEGDIGAGDAIEVISRPEGNPTIMEMARIRVYEVKRAGELVGLTTLSPKWKDWAEKASSS